ncbi:hypothetical protein [Streptomyces sp. NPDC049916]|uniref:hypothetical protein n=1 Tax=unclassified Streptomyces TaxID=2593676 RepID=UPI003446EB27
MATDFEREWRRASAEGAGSSASTRLNGVPPEPSGAGGGGNSRESAGESAGGGGAPDLASSPARKKAAAADIETELEPRTKKTGEHADSATETARKGFDGWETAAGLKTVADTWDKQVTTLMGRLASEKNALRGASGLFARNDTGVRDQLLSQSGLNGL